MSAVRQLVHGFLTVEGRFRDLSLVNQPPQAAPVLLATLSKWSFRPATRDNVPVEVEALLAIPPAR
jgi:hypothetical protein